MNEFFTGLFIDLMCRCWIIEHSGDIVEVLGLVEQLNYLQFSLSEESWRSVTAGTQKEGTRHSCVKEQN